MKSWLQLCSHGGRTMLGWGGWFALWSLWLALALLLVGQLYILTSRELALPAFALRQIESRLAEAGLRATFGRTSFDPTGRVLMENVRLSLPTIPEPIATIGSIYAHVNPLHLVVGRVELDDVRLVRAQLAVPTLLSPTGRAEEIVRDLEATLEPAGHLLHVRQLHARIAGVTVSAHGTLPLPRRAAPQDRDTLAAFLAKQFPALCRHALAAADRLAQAEEPALLVDFAPSESGALSLHVTALARAVRLAQPVQLEAREVRATTRLLLFGEAPPTHLEVSAAEIRLPGDTIAKKIAATVYGRFQTEAAKFDLREIALAVGTLRAGGVDAQGLSARIHPRPLPQLAATIVAHVLDAPLAVWLDADLTSRQAHVRFEGEISPRVLDVIGARLGGLDVRRFYDFDALTAEHAEAIFGPNWKFEKLRARVRIPRMNSYGVIMEDGRAVVELEPHRFRSPEAFARIGENFARGTYEHDLVTHRYRFLLDGQLRPLAIGGWFREWWPNFFRQLDFASGPPEASVDVQGEWRDGGRSHIFVFADGGRSAIRGVDFDRVRARLFIRPAFFDGLEVLARRGDARAQGRFTLVSDPVSLDWRSLELGLDSTLDLEVAARLLGPDGARALAPFKLAAPPELKLRGSFAGPGAPQGTPAKLRVEARTVGEFRFHNFPVRDASFVATIDGEEVSIDDFEAAFADGVAGGRARVWNAAGQRRLGFDFALREATLGELAGQLSEFFAAKKGQPAPPPGKFVKEKAAVKLNFAASAEGRYDDPLSYRGAGSVALHGAEIGEVPLLGLLSELLKFTSLRFTEARGNFQIEGPRLVFPKIEVRGANSAIDAHGDYAIDRRALDFNARIFPFQESDNLIKSVVGAVLTPLSNAFEVKLTGTLEKPEWGLALGHSHLFRERAEDRADQPAGDAPAPVATPAAPKP